ncbi:MAG: hypothetical protein ACODAQ_02130 [Phycisphaeraceae bacterium]
MRTTLTTAAQLTAWTFVALALIYAAVGPTGALYDNPLACVGLGLIGLGLTLEARRRSPALLPVRAGRRRPRD